MPRLRLFLASRRLPGLADWLGAGVRRVAFVPIAADPLPDRAAIVGEVEAALAALGLEVATDLAAADAIVVGGGDPYHLLARLRATGLDARLVAAVRAGLPYVGISAGAMVAGPSLAPQASVSPFAPPPDLDLAGLALTDAVVFPHRTKPGRAERIARARDAFGDRFRIVPLADDEVAIEE
jgi:dipeptidase E